MFIWQRLQEKLRAPEGEGSETTTETTQTTEPLKTEETTTETPKTETTQETTKTEEAVKAPATSLAGGTEETEKTPEEKAAADKAEADKKADGTKDVDGNDLPEAYEFKLPDGYAADEGLTAEAQSFFKENKFSPAQAQAAIDLHAKILGAQTEAWAKTQQEWVDAAKSDPTVGGKAFDANMGTVRSVIREFGDDDVRKAFNDTGAGNHPAILRMLYKVGKALGENTAPPKDANTVEQGSLAATLYGKTTPTKA